jgi:serine/threonine protein kinase
LRRKNNNKMATDELRRIERSEIAEKYGITESDLDELELLGIKLPEEPVEIGRGLTRVVYRAMHQRGQRKMEVAVKIPHEVSPEDSIIGYINTTRRDVNRREVDVHNFLEGHNRIVPILGTVETEDGRTICFEPFKNRAISLEEFVRDHGKITDESIAVGFIGNLIEPFLHLRKNYVVHRDVKPSNILMDSDGPMLTDFQNATRDIGNSDNMAQPTRGGTAYTRYTLINKLLKGEETRYTREDEMHPIAATIIYALTGTDPFDYRIRGVPVEDDYKLTEKETVVKVNGKKFLIKLSSDGKDLEEITEAENTRRVRSAISKMDKNLRNKYGSLLERCLIPSHKKSITSIEGFKKEFDRINSSFYLKLKERLIAGAKFVLPTATAVGISSLLIGGLKYLGSVERESPPSVAEMLRHEDYMKYSLSDLEAVDKTMVYPILVPYMKKAEQMLPEIEGAKDRKRDEVAQTVNFAHDVHRLPKRLVSAWLRACYLNRNLASKYGNTDKDRRLEPCFVPESFMIQNSMIRYMPSDAEDERRVNAQGIMYLKLCLGPNQTVDDTFADYFSSRLEQSNSIARTGSANYLPRTFDWKIRVGYHKFLPGHQRELINSAVALYLITDDNGDIHYDWIPEITPPHGLGESGAERCVILKDIHEKRELSEITK